MSIPIERKSTAHFMKWIVNDILTEEVDSLIESGLIGKDVTGAISNHARKFWFKETDKL